MIPDFLNVAVAGVPLALVVLALGQLYGMLGAKGKVQLILSFVTGFLLGFGYMLAQSMPTDFAQWFSAVVYGLSMGALPVGVYEALKHASQKGAELAMKK